MTCQGSCWRRSRPKRLNERVLRNVFVYSVLKATSRPYTLTSSRHLVRISKPCMKNSSVTPMILSAAWRSVILLTALSSIRPGMRSLTTSAYMQDFRLLWESLTFFQPLVQTKKSLPQRGFRVSVQSGPLHHAHHHQDLLLAGDRADRAVRHLRHFFGIGRDGDQPVRRIYPAVVLDRQRGGRDHLFAYRRRIHPDRVSHQRAPRRNPRPRLGALGCFALILRSRARRARSTG